MSAQRKPLAFTLLETIIAMAILGVSLLGIFEISSQAVVSHVYAKKLSVATLLARSKMIDIEQELYDKGFNADDDEEAGDFSDEGWASFKWRAKIIAPKTQGLSPEQLIGAIFNLPLGMGGDSKDGQGGAGDPLSALAGLFGGGGLGGAAGGGDLAKLAGSLGGAQGGLAGLAGQAGGGLGQGLMQQQFQMMVDQLTKSVREVHLTITWKEGKQTESFDVVTHVVSIGVGSDRNGQVSAAAQAMNAVGNNSQASGQWVRADNGQPVPNPVPGPAGMMVDPTDHSPVIPLEAYNAARAGPNAPNPAALGGSRTFSPTGLGNLPPRPRGF